MLKLYIGLFMEFPIMLIPFPIRQDNIGRNDILFVFCQSSWGSPSVMLGTALSKDAIRNTINFSRFNDRFGNLFGDKGIGKL
jgi:hypothetical protein